MTDYKENVDFIPFSVYDDENTLIGGGNVTSKEILSEVFKCIGSTQAEAARGIGLTPQQLSGRMVRNSLRADEFLALLEGVEVDIQFIDRKTGNPIKFRKTGAGRRVRSMVNKVIYDTAASEAMSNNFYADGINEYTDGKAMELYMDKEGRYFFAEYSSWEGTKDRITPITANDAAIFMEKYGTEIHKSPKTE